MPLVQRQHVTRPVPLREHDDGGVRQTDRQVRVTPHDLDRGDNVVSPERFQPVGAPRDLVQERQLCFRIDLRGKQIVQLGKDERGEEERRLALERVSAQAAW